MQLPGLQNRRINRIFERMRACCIVENSKPVRRRLKLYILSDNMISKNKSEECSMVYYQEGFCGIYRQSMPVVYEKNNDGEYHKIKMYCENRKGCEKGACECFENAPETMQAHLMREKPY